MSKKIVGGVLVSLRNIETCLEAIKQNMEDVQLMLDMAKVIADEAAQIVATLEAD